MANKLEGSYYDGANERILSRVPSTAIKALEIGCASGRLGGILKARNPALEYWGIEAVEEVVEVAKARLDRVVVGDVEAMRPLPLPDGYFDCAIFGDVLEHLREPGELLERVRPHLTKDATVICNAPNVAHWSVVAKLLQGEFPYEDQGLLDRTHLRFFTPKSLRATLWDSGYVVVGEDAFCLPELAPARAIGRAAAAIGLDRRAVEDAASVYQQLFVARPAPEPYSQPEKMGALVGPHVGKLGPASKRCSVIVLTYNSMNTLRECLESVAPTLSEKDELILVDNASQDGTPKAIQQFFGRNGHLAGQAIINQHNLGFSAGCNVGALRSCGEYVVLLNPDTQVSAGWLEGLISRFGDETVAAVGPSSDNVCGDQFFGQNLLSGPKRSSIPTKLLIGFCLALRRDVLDRFGLLEEACFLGADDLEISWRLRTLGFSLMVAGDVFVAHRSGSSFSTLKPGEKERLVGMSDQGLVQKLRGFYGGSAELSSEEIWGIPIFAPALVRPQVSLG